MPFLPDNPTSQMSYQDKKAFYDGMLTIYGRKAVEEALQDAKLPVYRLHLADSNKKAPIIERCLQLAEQRGLDVAWHDRRKLSFISKNARQDQGIALDIRLDNLKSLAELDVSQSPNLVVLDNITNPQNVGMIIRSVAAGFVDGLVIPRKGCAELGPLVIKASAGTLFKAPIYRCETVGEAFESLKKNYCLAALALSDNAQSLYDYVLSGPTAFILGNESHGISPEAKKAADRFLKIPMNHDVESLNVAVSAALVAFHPTLLEAAGVIQR